MNFSGLIIALITFVAIGLGFVWVIRLEYWVGARSAILVGVIGLVVVSLSALAPGFWCSAAVGILGGTIVWGAAELPSQEKRARAGQFPVRSQRSEKDGR